MSQQRHTYSPAAFLLFYLNIPSYTGDILANSIHPLAIQQVVFGIVIV